MDIATILDSISDSGYVRYMDYCRDLTEHEREAIAPYVYWTDGMLWLTVKGAALAKEAQGVQSFVKRSSDRTPRSIQSRNGARAA